MKIPTNLEILNTIFRLYNSDFVAFEKNNALRDSKIYVPIDCQKIANEFKVDSDIIFGRLYYHLDKQYGYKTSSGTKAAFFTIRAGNDSNCVNFPLMVSVLAELRLEKKNFWIGTTIAVFALVVSAVSLTVSITN